MTVATPSHRIDSPPIQDADALGHTCTLLIQLRGNWIKAKSDLTLQEALMIGATAAQRSELPVQVRGIGGEVLVEL